jgi:hypothetical protein
MQVDETHVAFNKEQHNMKHVGNARLMNAESGITVARMMIAIRYCLSDLASSGYAEDAEEVLEAAQQRVLTKDERPSQGMGRITKMVKQ